MSPVWEIRSCLGVFLAVRFDRAAACRTADEYANRWPCVVIQQMDSK
jgi:hypothetical protein